MIGWDLRVYSGSTVKVVNVDSYSYPKISDGKCIYYVPPTAGFELMDSVRAAQIKIISSTGYPFIFTARVGDLPFELPVTDDEIVHVVMWDQS